MIEKLEPGQPIMIEIPRPDGSTCIYVGAFVEATPTEIVIDHAAWIGQTGRRHLFLAGSPDERLEVEPHHEDNDWVSLPRWGAVVARWSNPLFRRAV